MDTSNAHRRQIALALSLIALAAMAGELITPTTTRPSGRWSFLFGFIWDHGGSFGIALYWASISLVFIVAYLALKKGK